MKKKPKLYPSENPPLKLLKAQCGRVHESSHNSCTSK